MSRRRTIAGSCLAVVVAALLIAEFPQRVLWSRRVVKGVRFGPLDLRKDDPLTFPYDDVPLGDLGRAYFELALSAELDGRASLAGGNTAARDRAELKTSFMDAIRQNLVKRGVSEEFLDTASEDARAVEAWTIWR